MLSERQVAAVEDTAAELERRRTQRPQGASVPRKRELSEDQIWARKNLRHGPNGVYLDVANVIRVFKQHETFKGRFKYSEVLGMVLDKGSVMLDWRVIEATAIIQERFMPTVTEADVKRALLVVGNHAIARKE